MHSPDHLDNGTREKRELWNLFTAGLSRAAFAGGARPHEATFRATGRELEVSALVYPVSGPDPALLFVIPGFDAAWDLTTRINTQAPPARFTVIGHWLPGRHDCCGTSVRLGMASQLPGPCAGPAAEAVHPPHESLLHVPSARVFVEGELQAALEREAEAWRAAARQGRGDIADADRITPDLGRQLEEGIAEEARYFEERNRLLIQQEYALQRSLRRALCHQPTEPPSLLGELLCDPPREVRFRVNVLQGTMEVAGDQPDDTRLFDLTVFQLPTPQALQNEERMELFNRILSRGHGDALLRNYHEAQQTSRASSRTMRPYAGSLHVLCALPPRSAHEPGGTPTAGHWVCVADALGIAPSVQPEACTATAASDPPSAERLRLIATA